MVPIMLLWLPILVSAVIVFIASSIINAVLPYHRADYRKVPSEDEVMEMLRKIEILPGDYKMPHAASPKESGGQEFITKMEAGPNAMLTVWSGPPNMGKLLAFWFLYCVVISIFAAYISGSSLASGAEYLAVFRLAGCTAFVGYAISLWQNSIWSGRAWSTTLKFTFDGLVYALLTGGTFGWLWPV